MNKYRASARPILLCLCAVFPLLVASCASHAPRPAGRALHYHPAKLASGVPARPGSVAWSPDGKLIAWTGNQLTVYNRETGRKTMFPIEKPQFIAWSPDGLLYALTRDANGDVFLSSLDTVTSRVTVLRGFEADAVYALPDGKSLVLVSAALKPMSMGTQINTAVMVLSTTEKMPRTVARQSRTAMIKNADPELWTAWLHAGINPLDFSLFVMEHMTPPLIASYTVVNSMDLATGETSAVTGAGSRKRYLSGSWSPDGNRVVLSDMDGRLEIRSRTGNSVILDPSVNGIYPSWNPAGSTIYAGGFLVDSAGTGREQLLTDAAASIGEWSPDGTMLAVSIRDDLFLFRGIQAAFIPPDGSADKTLVERLSLLRGLVLDGSISPGDYKERRNRLTGKKENHR